MSRNLLWVISAILFIGAIYLMYVYVPGQNSDLARKGLIGYGKVQMKDSIPTPEKTVYTVTLIYEDDQHKNHMNKVEMYDTGAWDRLQTNQDIKVYYLPNDPDHGSIPGGQGMTTPKAGAYRFLGWSAIFAAIGLAVYGYFQPKPEPRAKGPVMTRR